LDTEVTVSTSPDVLL